MNVRRVVLERAGRRCERCGMYIRDGLLASYHHRVRRSQIGQDTPENLVLLDGSGTTGCHGWVHAHPEAAIAEGFLLMSWQEPATTPIRTPRGMALIGEKYEWIDRAPSEPMTVQEILREHS